MTDTNDLAGAETPAPVLPQDATPAEPTTPDTTPAPDEAGGPPDAAPDSPDPSDPAPKPKSGWQREQEKRAELERKVAAYELQLDAKAREVEHLQAEFQASKTPKPTDPGPKPSLDRFDSVEAYEAALEQWSDARTEWNTQAQLKDIRQRQEQEREQQEVRQKLATVQARAEAFAAATPDYAATVRPYLGYADASPVLAEYLGDSEAAPRVFYELCKRPEVLKAVLQAPPVQAFRHLIDLEARLTAPPPPKPATQAPPPISPVGGNATADKDPNHMSDAELAAWLRKQKKQP